MATTGAVAVDAMVKARVGAAIFTQIDGAPEHGPIAVLEDKVSKVVTTFNIN